MCFIIYFDITLPTFKSSLFRLWFSWKPPSAAKTKQYFIILRKLLFSYRNQKKISSCSGNTLVVGSKCWPIHIQYTVNLTKLSAYEWVQSVEFRLRLYSFVVFLYVDLSFFLIIWHMCVYMYSPALLKKSSAKSHKFLQLH